MTTRPQKKATKELEQWVSGSPLAEDPGLFPSIHMKRLGSTAYCCNPRAGEVETGGSLGHDGQSLGPTWSAPCSVRDPVLNNNMKSDRGRYPKLTSDLHMHSHACSCRLNANTHTHRDRDREILDMHVCK